MKYVLVCVYVPMQNVTNILPKPTLPLCGAETEMLCLILPQRQEKNLLLPQTRVTCDRFCFLFALPIGSEDEYSNAKNGLVRQFL